jgi:hypothetical protein
MLCLAACTFKNLGSNSSDGGTCAAPTTVQGSGTVAGALSLTAQASYESAQQEYSLDGGLLSTWLSVSLYENPVTCAAAGSADGGAGRVVALVLTKTGASVTRGVYTAGASDGGATSDGTGALLLGTSATTTWVSRSGTVTLTDVQDCAVAGSLDLMVGLSDGGSAPLTGSFSSVYCKR